MINKLNQLIEEYNNLTEKMSNPDIISNIKAYSELAKEHRKIDIIIPKLDGFRKFYHINFLRQY